MEIVSAKWSGCFLTKRSCNVRGYDQALHLVQIGDNIAGLSIKTLQTTVTFLNQLVVLILVDFCGAELTE